MTKKENACDLNTCFLCNSCLKDWKPAIEINKRNIAFKRGQQIFLEGEVFEGIYFVYKGKVKVHQKWDDEKELILRFSQKGDMIGHLGLGGSGVYPVSATALEDVTVCFIGLSFLEATMDVNKAFVMRLMNFFTNELYESEKRMGSLAHMPVKGRVAQALLSLQHQFGKRKDGSIDIQISRQDLASFTGTSYESVFRTINELLEEKTISIIGKNIEIINQEALNLLVKRS